MKTMNNLKSFQKSISQQVVEAKKDISVKKTFTAAGVCEVSQPGEESQVINKKIL